PFDGVLLHRLANGLRNEESLSASARPSCGDRDHSRNGVGISFNPLPHKLLLQGRLVGGHAGQEDPQPPAAPATLGGQLGWLSHLAAVSADLLAERIEIFDRGKDHWKRPARDDDTLLINWEEAGASRLDAD